jgi:hypothetical protein
LVEWLIKRDLSIVNTSDACGKKRKNKCTILRVAVPVIGNSRNIGS